MSRISKVLAADASQYALMAGASVSIGLGRYIFPVMEASNAVGLMARPPMSVELQYWPVLPAKENAGE